MIISGIQRFSTLDFPGLISCIVFIPGCNFRCKYCHNSEFVIPEEIEKIKDSFIPEEIFFNFLKKRKNKLDGVVITGGEPTMQKDLKRFILKIKKCGFLVKLDTNGTNPDLIKDLLDNKILDYIAMDVKAPLDKYKKIIDIDIDTELIKRSIDIIKSSDTKHEFRTTIEKSLLDIDDIMEIGKLVSGCMKYSMQKVKINENVLNKKYKFLGAYTDEWFLQIKKMLIDEHYVDDCEIR